MDKRASMYNKMQNLMDDSGVPIFIMHPPSVVMYRDNIKPGLYPNGGFKLSDFSGSKLDDLKKRWGRQIFCPILRN